MLMNVLLAVAGLWGVLALVRIIAASRTISRLKGELHAVNASRNELQQRLALLSAGVARRAMRRKD